MNHEEDGEGDLCKYAFGPDEYEVYKILEINTDDYEKSDSANSDEESHSNSNLNSTSNSESNWDTVSDTDMNPGA